MVTRASLTSMVAVLLAVAYPALVFLALQYHCARAVSLLVAALCVARFLTLKNADSGALWFLVAALAAAGFTLITDSPLGVKSYPVLMNLVAFAVFAYSLKRPPTVIERLARLKHPELPAKGVRYTRQVTVVWCWFFAVNASIATATLFLSDRIWALYNGLVAYLAMGLLLGGEWLLRPKKP